MAQYKKVTWADDQLIDAPTLNQMTANEEYLFDNMVRAYYVPAKRTKNIKVLAGILAIPKTTHNHASNNQGFWNYFQSTCRPIITASHVGTGRTFLTIRGYGNTRTIDHRGFIAHIEHESSIKSKNHFPNTQYIHWIAIGY